VTYQLRENANVIQHLFSTFMVNSAPFLVKYVNSVAVEIQDQIHHAGWKPSVHPPVYCAPGPRPVSGTIVQDQSPMKATGGVAIAGVTG